MVGQDEGIFLRKIKYGESGFVLSLLTKENGIQSFILQGVKGKKKSINATLHPLAILNLEFVTPRKGKLNRLKEVQFSEPLYAIRSDFSKNAIAYFLSEVVWKSLPENEFHPHLYSYVKAAIHFLDSHDHLPNFHLIFLIRFTRFLGFYPNGQFRKSEFFDLREGLFTSLRPIHIQYLEADYAKKFQLLLDAELESSFDFDRETKSELLNKIVEYYHIHLDNFGSLKTLKVLQEVFS